MDAAGNQIVVYRPNETVRLDVRLENETVWLTQSQMATLFGCSSDNVGLHLKNVYAAGELVREATTEEFSVVRMEGSRQVRRKVTCYNLDAIISVGYRVNSILGVKFRQWATKVLHDYLLRGYSFNARMNQLEDKMDRRLAQHDQAIVDLKEKVDFFVQTKEPPLQGVFYDGQLWDARALVLKLIQSAKRSLILIDNWATAETLDLFAKKRKGVKVTVITSEHYDKKHVPHRKISNADITTFNAQYPKLAVRYNEAFHDRFLIIDDKELYLINAPQKRFRRFGGEIRRRRTRRALKRPRASLKDLGHKCFGFTKMDAGAIRGITKSAFRPAP